MHEGVFEAINEYNLTIHSVKIVKPFDVFRNPNEFSLWELLKQKSRKCFEGAK